VEGRSALICYISAMKLQSEVRTWLQRYNCRIDEVLKPIHDSGLVLPFGARWRRLPSGPWNSHGSGVPKSGDGEGSLWSDRNETVRS
jgi:hypothetical protein